MTAQGTVRSWNAEKGFGFIQSTHSSNVFFHVRDFRGAGAPAVGMAVVYEEIQVGGKGPRAMQVRPTTATATATGPPHRGCGHPQSASTAAPRRLQEAAWPWH